MAVRFYRGLILFILILAVGSVHALERVSADGLTVLDLSKGSITIDADGLKARTPNGGTATANQNGYIIILGSGSSTANTLTVQGGQHRVVLQNVVINTGYNGASPILVSGAGTQLRLELSGSNKLNAGNPNRPAVGVGEGSHLVIDTVDQTEQHRLQATGYGGYAAAIGGGKGETPGEIDIHHGTIEAGFARSGNYGAAIGGGQGGAGGKITIYGGHVTAESYGGTAAAIGGGQSATDYSGKTTEVAIHGGWVSTKIPNGAAYDSIGYGKVAASKVNAVQAETSVTIAGGQVVARNSSNNTTHLLYNRQPLNANAEALYAVSLRLDNWKESGSPVEVAYSGGHLATWTGSNGQIIVFLSPGEQQVRVTLSRTGDVYVGQFDVQPETGKVVQTAVASRLIQTVPVLEVVNAADEDRELNDGKTSVLRIANLAEVVNAGGYALEAGTDYTVEWFNGSVPVAGNLDDAFSLTVTPNVGDRFRARFTALDGGQVQGTSSFSSTVNTQAAKEPLQPEVATRLEVSAEAEFTRLPDPTAGAIVYTVRLVAEDGSSTPIEGATVRFYPDGGSPFYTRVTGSNDQAGTIRYTFGGLLPGEHTLRIVFDGGQLNGTRYDATSYETSFTVVKPDAPTGFTTIAAKSGTTNGKIFGADPSQEYIDWIPTIGNNQQIHQVTGTVIENLPPNLYSIRYKGWYDGNVYSLASDYRYLVWVQTAQWTVTPVETDSVVWSSGPVDVIAGGSAQWKVEAKEGYVIRPEHIQFRYAESSYDPETKLLTLDRITSNLQLEIHAEQIAETE